jgi:hypothetical protein
MYDAVIADAIQQELQSDATAEADVRDHAAALNLRCVNRGGDCLLVAPVECTRDERTQDAVRAAQLASHRR